MKMNKELLNIVGDIDDDLIEMAEPGKGKIRVRKKRVMWTRILSSAAVVALGVGLYYNFMIKPITNAPGNENDIQNMAVTSASDVTSVSVPHEETDIPKNADIRTFTSETFSLYFPGDDESFWQLSEEDKTLYSKIYITAVVDGKVYDFDHNINGNTSSGPNRAVVSEDHVFVLHGRALYSALREDGSFVNSCGGFYGDFYIPGYTRMLGTNTSGELYMLNNESGEYHLLKYSPELELLSEEISVIVSDGEYHPVFDAARGFDDITLKENLLCIKYGEEGMIEYDLESGEYYSEYEFSSESKQQNIADGIFRSGEYLYAEDSTGEVSLTLFTYNIKDNHHFDGDVTDLGDKIVGYCVYDTCIDEAVRFEVKTEAHFDVLKKYDSNGNVTETFSGEDRVKELVPDYSVLSDFMEGKSTLNNTGYSLSDVPESLEVRSIAVCHDGSVLLSFANKYDGSAAEGAVVSPEGKCRIINSEELNGNIKTNDSYQLSPQKDGTFLYIIDGVMYSFDTADDSVSAVCEVPEYNRIMTDDIIKISDSSYFLSHSSLDSDMNRFYIMTVSDEK